MEDKVWFFVGVWITKRQTKLDFSLACELAHSNVYRTFERIGRTVWVTVCLITTAFSKTAYCFSVEEEMSDCREQLLLLTKLKEAEKSCFRRAMQATGKEKY